MFVRSPLHAWISDPEWYYRSVTAHGPSMGYVFPTLVAMGFGYCDHRVGAEAAADRTALGLDGLRSGPVGAVTAMVPVSLGRASVLYTFYPPLIGSPFYYIGVVLVVVGSWIWVALMSINLAPGSATIPGRPVPLADVRQCRRLLSLGMDRGRRGARTSVSDPAGRARPEVRRSMPDWRACSSPGRCMRSSISG